MPPGERRYAGMKAKPKRTEQRAPGVPQREDLRAFVAAIGRLVRLARAKRGMTRRQLAQASGASERYLAQIEGGEGNPSVIMLASIAQRSEERRVGKECRSWRTTEQQKQRKAAT